MAIDFYAAATLPNALAIVWCRFPTNEMPRSPSPKERPGLVRSVKLQNQQTEVWVEVAYGTTKYTPFDRPFDLHIQNSSEIDKCGLLRATCFVLDRYVWLLWSPMFFCVRKEDGLGPIVGHLTEQARMQLEAVKVMRRSNAINPQR